MKIRPAARAGQFYPATAQEIKKQISSFVDKEAVKKNVIACMLPHAGYDYSGRVATQTLSRINIPDKIILLGPNHTGLGAPYSIMTEGLWQTPLGEVKINSLLAKKILQGSKYLEDSSEAHAGEHCLEVELPLLQYFKKDFEIVPIVFMSMDTEILKKIGAEIANAVKDEKSCLIIASSDMTHFESQDQAERKDKQAIEAILELNEDKLIERVERLDISMCGFGPAVAMITAAKLLGAKRAELIKYQTSADTTGDKESVVGYAGITVE